MSIERRERYGRTHYVARVRYRGERISYWRETIADAELAEAQAKAAIARGEAPPEPERRQSAGRVPERPITVEDAADDFISGAETGRIRSRSGRPYKPATIRRYEERLRLHVLPRIGAERLANLRRGDVMRLVEDVAHECSPSLARDVRDTLRLCLQRQVDLEMIAANPAAGIATITPERRPIRFLTPEEAARLEAAASTDEHPAAYPFVRLALGTGARLGEVLALTWSDIDLERCEVHVRATWDRVERASGSPKSGRARVVHIGPDLTADLRRWRLASAASLDRDYVIPLRDVRVMWRRVRRAAVLEGRQPVVHDLRHTAATFMLAARLTPHAVAEQLGHTTARLVLETYGHALPREMSSAGERLEAWRRLQ